MAVARTARCATAFGDVVPPDWPDRVALSLDRVDSRRTCLICREVSGTETKVAQGSRPAARAD